MKVGDYVRYKTLSNQIKINKIINIVEPNDGELSMTNIILYDLDNKDVTADKYIIKSSPNPKELLKVGDVIRVFSDLHDLLGNSLYEIKDEKHLKHLKNGFDNGYFHLISVVTKEQFKSMEYEVE